MFERNGGITAVKDISKLKLTIFLEKLSSQDVEALLLVPQMEIEGRFASHSLQRFQNSQNWMAWFLKSSCMSPS